MMPINPIKHCFGVFIWHINNQNCKKGEVGIVVQSSRSALQCWQLCLSVNVVSLLVGAILSSQITSGPNWKWAYAAFYVVVTSNHRASAPTHHCKVDGVLHHIIASWLMYSVSVNTPLFRPQLSISPYPLWSARHNIALCTHCWLSPSEKPLSARHA